MKQRGREKREKEGESAGKKNMNEYQRETSPYWGRY